ncbi:MAG: alpha/beta hydrolase, partial [Vicinamibacteria bacterium]
QGERDEFSDREAIESFVKSVPGPVELAIVPGADHFFNGRMDEVEQAVGEWLDGGPGGLP